jgi:CubicO group peptidase (beta-lactamase class C family)
MKCLSIPLLLTVLLSPLAFATAAGPAERTPSLPGRESGARFLPDGKSPVFSTAFKENIEYRVNNNIITGIVVGVVTPRGTSFFSCGVMSMETNEPVDENSVFEIGSISKTFTGILLAEDVLNGGLSLNDPLQKLLPEGITAPTRNGKSINLVHLANHTSSLPRMPDSFIRINPDNPYAEYTVKQAYDFLGSYELPRDIGSEFEYSNYGMGLLGTVLAARHHTTYEELMIEKIANPLGMEHTRIVLSPDMEKRLAKGHHFGIEVGNWDFLAIAGAGAIRSTAVDMLRYLAGNMGLIKSELLPAMELSHQNSGSTIADMTVGLGWIKKPYDGGEIVWHDGGTGGYMSFIGFTKENRKGVVVLTNSQGFPDDIGFHLLNPESELANPKPSIATELNRIAERDGIGPAVEAFAELKNNNADDYDFSESELNELGNLYLNDGRTIDALAVFKTNVKAFPDSWVVYASYGEALLKNGEKQEAIDNYMKSLELNPDNHDAIEILKKLGVDLP